MVFRLMILSVVVMATFAEPDPKPAADPQYYNKYSPPVYEPKYPKAYKPDYPSYKAYPEPYAPKTAYPTVYPEASYGSAYYKKDHHYCDPRAPPKCAHNASSTYCLKDYEYPEEDVQYAIEYDPLILKKYADVADQSANHLVDGVTSVEENQFDYSNYHGSTFEKGNWVGGEGYICPSDVLYARPVRAKNVDGEWRVIVQNVAYYTQTQRVETCLFAGASCRTLAPCYQSKCVQKYVYHRMLSFDPCDTYKGLFIDIFKLPSACSCHIPASKLH